MQTPKKFSSFSDQVSWISDEKGIKIKDREYAEEMLRQIGYFPLMGGYKHLFRISNTKKYKAGTSFEKSEVGFFDIILMDIMMPIMDGLEAAREIRSSNRMDGLAVPIIAMSANAFEEDIEKSLAAGMNEHLIKPLDGPKVTSTMKKYLANKIVGQTVSEDTEESN